MKGSKLPYLPVSPAVKKEEKRIEPAQRKKQTIIRQFLYKVVLDKSVLFFFHLPRGREITREGKGKKAFKAPDLQGDPQGKKEGGVFVNLGELLRGGYVESCPLQGLLLSGVEVQNYPKVNPYELFYC